MTVNTENNKLTVSFGGARLIVEPWGESSVRVRMYPEAAEIPECERLSGSSYYSALTEPVSHNCTIRSEEIDTTDPWYKGEEYAKYHQTGTDYFLTNGKLTVKLDNEGRLSFRNQRGEVLTEEYWRDRNRINRYCVPLRITGRELKPHQGGTDYEVTARFEAYDNEKIFGMGQYQDSHLNKKGSVLELCHRNSQASVPFYISSRGYGFLWNNPAVGTATFGMNKTEWYAKSAKYLDYFITAGDTPAEITGHYTAAAGRAPRMPEYGLGYWQCKLRYRNQEEILAVAREHKRRGLPMDAIVVDFFHWTMQGDFKFEPRDWPDPEAMVKELRELGIETVVSVWPTIDERSENFGEMADKGMLVSADRGSGLHMTWMGNTVFYDATNPEAQKFVWEKCRENYYSKGIRCFWLDEAEPGIRSLRLRQLPLLCRHSASVHEHLSADVRQGILRRTEGSRRKGHTQPGPLRLGRKPEIWCSHLVRGYSLQLPCDEGTAPGWAFHERCRDSLVDFGHRRIPRRKYPGRGIPGAAGALVRVGVLLPCVQNARRAVPLV